MKRSEGEFSSFDLSVALAEAALHRLGKGVLKTGSKFTGEHSCRSVILIKLLCNFIEVILWH